MSVEGAMLGGSFLPEKEFKEFLKVYSKEEKIVNPGKHCSMCPYILICKEGEYPIERNN